MTRDEAAEILAKELYERGAVRAYSDTMSLIYNPPPSGEKWQQAHRFFNSLRPEAKAIFRFVIADTAVTAAFGIAAYLDGVAGHTDVEGAPAEFSIELRRYQDSEEIRTHCLKETVPVCPTTEGEDVHDILLSFADENPLG